MMALGPIAFSLLFLTQSGPLPPEAAIVPKEVVSVAGYTEGVVFDHEGNAYVSLLHRNQVLRLPPGAQPEVWATLEQPNGHKILPDGGHLIATKGGILRLRRDGSVVDTVISRFDGVPLHGPNDIALDGNGGFYFTDPAATDSTAAARLGHVYYVDARGQARLAAADFCYSNGLLVRMDGRVLYVDDSCTSHVYAFDIVRPGVLANRRIFAALPDSGQGALDGMTADEEGNLYIAHYRSNRIEVVDRNGNLVRRYPAGSQLSSNVAFAGARSDELYVTGAPGAETGPGVVTRLNLPGVRGRGNLVLPMRIE